MTKRTFNPGWKSAQADRESRAAAQRMRLSRQRKREREQRINERLAPLGLTLDQVIEGLDDGTIGVYVVKVEAF